MIAHNEFIQPYRLTNTKTLHITMKKKRYEGILDEVPRYEIYLNINKLEKGKYKLKIMNKDNVIKSTYFSKE